MTKKKSDLELIKEENKKLIEYNHSLSETIDNVFMPEIETLKDNIRFLHSCLDDRDKSIEILQEEKENLNARLTTLYEVKEILRNVVVNLNRLDKLKEIVFWDDTTEEE